jgi:hypothetical protein
MPDISWGPDGPLNKAISLTHLFAYISNPNVIAYKEAFFDEGS